MYVYYRENLNFSRVFVSADLIGFTLRPGPEEHKFALLRGFGASLAHLHDIVGDDLSVKSFKLNRLLVRGIDAAHLLHSLENIFGSSPTLRSEVFSHMNTTIGQMLTKIHERVWKGSVFP